MIRMYQFNCVVVDDDDDERKQNITEVKWNGVKMDGPSIDR